MTCTSIFDHPTKGVYRYAFGKETAAAETQEARCYDGNQHFGRFLYSRPVRQVAMQVGTRYQLKVAGLGATLHYRRTDEVLYGQFDYFAATGSHGDRVKLLVEQSVTVPGLETQSKVTLSLELIGVRTFKFADLCKTCVFEVSLADGQAQLLGFRSESDSAPSISIPLQLVGA